MSLLPSAFSRVTKTSNRISSLLFVALPLLLVLLATLLWSAERIIDQEKRRLQVDFSSFIGYLREQETFLAALKKQNQNLSQLIESRNYSLEYQKLPSKWPLRLLEGKESVVAMPFTLACGTHLECNKVPSILFSLGAYLADYYSTFWGSSYFPAAAVFFVNPHDHISISVPSVGTITGNESITPTLYRTVTETVRNALPQLALQFEQDQNQGLDKVIWLHNDQLGNNLLGILPGGFDHNLWRGEQLSPKDIYAVTLFNRERISVLERILNPTLPHQFWLVHKEYGQLLGQSPVPNIEEEGLHYTKEGLLLKQNNKTGQWIGYYLIPYSAFFDDNLWLPSSLLFALIFSLLCGWGYHYWYQRYVLNPAVKAQNTLLDSEAFNRVLMDTTPIGLCVIEKQSQHILYINTLAQRWLNVPILSEAHLSPIYQQLLTIVTPFAHQETFSPFISGENTLYIAYAHTHYQQSEVVLCAFTDISAQAEIERQLTLAKLTAEEANQVKSNFLATMSHEIRTPLYGLIGTLELLSSTTLTEKQTQYLLQMDSVSRLLMHIIGDILDISKIDAEQLRLQQQPLNLLDVIYNTLQTYMELANQKGLLLFSCIDSQLNPERIGDPLRIQQILGNLISNAIKFTQKGSIIVQVRSTQNNSVTISVNDTGIGLTAVQKERLFEPFYQAHTASHTYGGTGLGLVISQRLVTLMNGDIHVNSQLGQGSQFTISIPLPLAMSAVIKPDLTGMNIWLETPHKKLTHHLQQWLTLYGAHVWLTQKEMIENKTYPVYLTFAPLTPPSHWKGEQIILPSLNVNLPSLISQLVTLKKPAPNTQILSTIPVNALQYAIRILVAEDNPINQLVLQEQLEQLGCEVTLADDGEEALALWDSSLVNFDMVLTDVNMPYLNGYELAQQLRKEGATCPIIGVTANGLKEEEEYCLAAGMNAWLVKPLDRITLIQLLEHYFPINQRENIKLIPQQITNPLHGPEREKIIQYLQNDIAQLSLAIKQQEKTSINQISHRLRGALVIVQQTEVATQLRSLEEQIIVSKNLNQIFDEYRKIADELHAWVLTLNVTY